MNARNVPIPQRVRFVLSASCIGGFQVAEKDAEGWNGHSAPHLGFTFWSSNDPDRGDIHRGAKEGLGESIGAFRVFLGRPRRDESLRFSNGARQRFWAPAALQTLGRSRTALRYQATRLNALCRLAHRDRPLHLAGSRGRRPSCRDCPYLFRRVPKSQAESVLLGLPFIVVTADVDLNSTVAAIHASADK